MPMENKEKEYVHQIPLDLDMVGEARDSYPYPMEKEEAHNMHVFH
jgi:hypothetical protein